MALSWTIGEFFCLTVLRWMANYPSGKRIRQQIPFILFISLCLISLIFLLFFFPEKLFAWLDSHFKAGFTCYTLLWLFFVNLWVAIECLCLIYLVRIKKALAERSDKKRILMTKKEYLTQLVTSSISILMIFTVYFVFNYSLLFYYREGLLNVYQMENLFAFYLRFTSLEFIIIEWSIGIISFRIYKPVVLVFKELKYA
jgi:hypothetical protein